MSAVPLVSSFPVLLGPQIQDHLFTNFPVDYPIHYPGTDVGDDTGALPEHDQPTFTIPSTSTGLSPSLSILLPALVPTCPAIGEMLARAAKARGSSAQVPK